MSLLNDLVKANVMNELNLLTITKKKTLYLNLMISLIF